MIVFSGQLGSRWDWFLKTEGQLLVSRLFYFSFFKKANSVFLNGSCLANPGKHVTCEITSAQKLKSRKSLASTFSLILFLAL